MGFFQKKIVKTGIILFFSGLAVIVIIAGIVIARTWGRTVLQINIHQNRELIYLSTFSEPPQFAIWLENQETKELQTVFVTHRVAIGDWEGKANVPVALPRWFELFRGEGSAYTQTGPAKKSDLAITGATPKEDYFSLSVEVKPGSKWICWIEMNLAGDFNDAFPEFNMETLKEDEFSCGQPALLFSCNLTATEGTKYTPGLTAQSVWENGEIRIEPVSEGVTTARDVFDSMEITVTKPKPRLINKYKVKDL